MRLKRQAASVRGVLDVWRDGMKQRHKILFGTILILVGLTLLRIAVAAQQADPPARFEPNLGEQWTPEAHLLLAQAVVGEAGWSHAVDHDAIPWLLYRRWQHIGGSFEGVVRAYCKALNGSRPWLLELDAEGAQPPSWPTNAASWSAHRKRWLSVYDRIGAWGHGEVSDPCASARHFGGGMDEPRGKMVPARCAGAKNNFWKIGVE